MIEIHVHLCIFSLKQKRILNMLLYCRETGLKLRNVPVHVREENNNVWNFIFEIENLLLMFLLTYNIIHGWKCHYVGFTIDQLEMGDSFHIPNGIFIEKRYLVLIQLTQRHLQNVRCNLKVYIEETTVWIFSKYNVCRHVQCIQVKYLLIATFFLIKLSVFQS